MRIPIATIEARRFSRPTGYVSAMLGAGTIEGDELLINGAEYERVRRRFNAWCDVCRNHTHRLEDCPSREGKTPEQIRREMQDCCTSPPQTPTRSNDHGR